MLDMERRTINLVSNDDSEEGEQEDEDSKEVCTDLDTIFRTL